MIAERLHKGTPEQFWQVFSDAEGNHLSYTTILQMLQEERKKEDGKIAEQAKAEYGSQFDLVFSYRKGKDGEKHVLSKPADIAKKYRKLQGGNTSD
jgi:hypothetical protein